MANKLPSMMPANDLVVTSTLKLNRYSVSFCVDGVEIGEYTGLYTFPIVYPEDPVKEGYRFKGWNPCPDTIPLGDTTLEAVFESTTLATPVIRLEEVLILDTPTIRLEEEIAAEEKSIMLYSRKQYNNNGTLAYTDYVCMAALGCVPGDPLPTREKGEVPGYTATDYTTVDGNPQPEVMPDYDIKLYRTFNLNTYTATFLVNGEVYGAYSGLYTFPIVYPKEPVKEGYEFIGWSQSPVNMPVDGITVEASFQVAKQKLSTPDIYLEVF